MWMILIAFLFGILVGGLINQLGSDLPARRGLTRPHCPYCGRERPWWKWLALPVYLSGRARCSSCGAPIRLRHPLIEIGMGVIYAYLWLLLGPAGALAPTGQCPSVKLILYALYSTIFALILITDIERRLILNVVIYPAILFAAIAGFFTPGLPWRYALLGGVIAFLFFLGAAVIGNATFGAGALGGGDVKLAAFIGLITGFPLVIEALLLAIIIGAVVSLILLLTKIRGLRDPVPYGPFLITGAMITLLWGRSIAEWFLYR
jgi:prepilin signal peptidase PulO-like enzyme (type II secretory pathway)